jgi:hypothetical protein
MGQAKIKRGAAFAPHLIDGWESRDCVAFARSRLTGGCFMLTGGLQQRSGRLKGRKTASNRFAFLSGITET